MLFHKSSVRSQLLRHSKYVYSAFLPLRKILAQVRLPEPMSCWLENTLRPRRTSSKPRPPPGPANPKWLAQPGKVNEPELHSHCLVIHHCNMQTHSTALNFYTSALSIIQPTAFLFLPKIKLKKLILERNNQGPSSIPIFLNIQTNWKARHPNCNSSASRKSPSLSCDLILCFSLSFIKGQCMAQPHENISLSRGKKSAEDIVLYNTLRSNTLLL